MIKSMPGFVSPAAPPSLSPASFTEQLLNLLTEGILFVPIHLLWDTIGTISPPANLTSPSSIPSQKRTLNWRRILSARQGAEGPFPGLTPAGRRESRRTIAR